MEEVKEPAELAEAFSTQENVSSTEKETPFAEVVDQAMVGAEDHLELDSRTYLAGRKRNLQDTNHGKDLDSGEGNGERSRKRIKDHQDTPLVREELITNITSSSIGGPLLAIVEAGGSDQPPPAKEPFTELCSSDPAEFGASHPLHANEPTDGVSSPSGAEADASDRPISKQSVSRFLQADLELSRALGIDSSLEGTSSKAREPVPASVQSMQPVAPPRTWNGGVTSSVRTSFGSKPRVSFELKGGSSSASHGQEAIARLPDRVDSNSVLSPNIINPAPDAPFRELSKEEQDRLTGEEKSLYLKSLFAQLRTPAPRTAATSFDTSPSRLVSRDVSEIDDDSNDSVSASADEELAPPKNFKKLGKAARKSLDPRARSEYDIALASHQREKSAKRRLRKAARAAKPVHELRAVVNDGKRAELFAPRHHHTRVPKMISNGDIDSSGEEEADPGLRDNSNDTPLDLLSQTTSMGTLIIPNFRYLNRAQLSLLSNEEQQVYERARKAYEQARSRSMAVGERELKQAKEQAQALARVAGATETKKEKKLRLLKEATKPAEEVIATGFPLADTELNSDILASMANGKTLYPRKFDSILRYTKGTHSWDIPEMMSVDGKPLQVSEFCFNDFAPYFLSLCQDSWSIITPKMLVAAFKWYLSNYYVHIGISSPTMKKCRATSTDHNAITIPRAKELAKQLLGRPAQRQVQLQSPNIVKPSAVATIPSQDEPMHVGGDIDMLDEGTADVDLNSHQAMEFVAAPIDDGELINSERRQEEIHLQQRYYPSSNLNIVHCLACSQTGHNTLQCPLIACKVCGNSGVHSEAMCPQKKRCQKCRDRGHQSQDCKEKLSLPQSEMSCDICKSSDHLEMACHYIWRSFAPKPEEILTVPQMASYCYTCGALGHFGPECGLHRGNPWSGGITWTNQNLMRFISVPSQSITPPAAVQSIPAKAANVGRATDPIYIDDSDDEPSSSTHQKALPPHRRSSSMQVQAPNLKYQDLLLPTKKQKKKKNKKKGAPQQVRQLPQIDPGDLRHPNPHRLSRPDFGFPQGPVSNNAPSNAPSGPRATTTSNNFGGMNGNAHASRGGGDSGNALNRRGGGGLSKADRRRMADQAGGRATRGGF